ncbi:beta-galactosidase [Kribbella sp. CCNWLW201]|uniref:beta-galactosidase n=1 Tax=Kribbella sp. CCNWLW201 TaxID=3127475 RepID=UPI003055F26E
MPPPRVVLGTAYYPEYLSRELHGRVDTDLDLMSAAGIGVIRVGESVWSTWEPRDGVFGLDWIRPVLVVPQENGVRSDVRWAELTDADGNGLRVEGAPHFQLTARRRPDLPANALIGDTEARGRGRWAWDGDPAWKGPRRGEPRCWLSFGASSSRRRPDPAQLSARLPRVMARWPSRCGPTPPRSAMSRTA